MKKLSVLLLAAAVALGVAAEEKVEYRADLNAVVSTGRYAPYMIGSWNSGRIVAGKAVYQGGRLERKFDQQRRFAWSYGLEYSAGYSNSFEYDRYNSAGWTQRTYRTSAFRLIQFYGALKYRQVFLLAGMKERRSPIVDGELSSGDLVRSNNARPIPGAAAGFIDFVDIPFTNGWVQINGELMYGRFTDNGFRRDQFNHYQGLLTQDLCYTYKSCHFRTNPSKPFSVIAGMQSGGEFGGSTLWYRRGHVTMEDHRGFHVRDLWDMFFPVEGSGEGYYKGNSFGSWDFKARYNFRNGSTLSAYFEWPWEDGSGIGRRNGWDGLWGLQYDFAPGAPVQSIVVEYLDFTNQSGPIHHTASDYPGTTLVSEANGGDNYWNNDFYGAYANYGMAIGTPFVLAPVYNKDGSPAFIHNRARGFHAAARGAVGQDWRWRGKFGYSRAGGQGRLPASRKLYAVSALAEAWWTPARVSLPGMELHAQVAFDLGTLRGDNLGVCVGLSYSGLFTVGKK